MIAIGIGLYGYSGLSPEMTSILPLPNTFTPSMLQNVDTNSTLGNFDFDESIVNTLMLEEGLDEPTATVVSKIDTEIKTAQGNYLNYEQTLSDGTAWDVQIRARPDQTYIPTEEELRASAMTGIEIYDISYSFQEVDGIPQLTLRYFVPYEAMSEELKTSIQSNITPPTAAVVAGFFPSAEASGGAAGAVFETIIKNLAKEGINKIADFSNLFAALDAATGAYKLSQSESYFGELDQLRNCAENPTNPLTKKMYQENPSEKAKVVDQINEAESQVKQLTAARILNLAAKTGSKFTGANLAGKLFFDSVAKWSDETLKEVAEGWIDDAKKGVVQCEKAPIRLSGTVKYRVSNSQTFSDNCDSYTACYEVKEEQSGSGKFSVTTQGSIIMGNGTGNYEQTRSRVVTKAPYHPLTEYNGGYNFVASGDVQIKVEGALFPTARFSVNGGGLLGEEGSSTQYIVKPGDSKVTAVTEETHRDTSGGFVCHFDDVDLVNGGKYTEEIIWGDTVVGSCEMELLPELD